MYHWIQDNESLTGAIEAIGTGPVAVDLEADSFHHYYEKVCLFQMSIDGTDYLIDPLAGLEMDMFRPVLENRSIRKIFHGADYDLRLLDRDFRLTVSGLFDTQIAARLAGERAFGLAALLEKHCGRRLDKRFQRADWSMRPLQEDMLAYAAEDTRHLQELAAVLEDRIEELGRSEWMDEECRHLEGVRWNARGGEDDAEPYLRVKGSRKLDRRALTVLRELHLFRDSVARRRNVPPFRVLRDALLSELAKKRPTDLEALIKVNGLPGAYVSGRGAEGIIRAIKAGCAAELVQVRKPRPRNRPKGASASKYRKVREAVDVIAGDLDIEPTLLVNRKLLEEILSRIDDDEEWEETPGLRKWQARLLAPVLERL